MLLVIVYQLFQGLKLILFLHVVLIRALVLPYTVVVHFTTAAAGMSLDQICQLCVLENEHAAQCSLLDKMIK